MRVVYCIASIYNPGGKDRVIVSKTNELAKVGIEVFIVTTDQNQRPSFFPLHPLVVQHDLGINYTATNTSSIIKRCKEKRTQQKRHKELLTAYIHKIKPDIIISTFEEDGPIIASLNTPAIKVMELHYSKERRYNEYVRAKLSPARILDFLRTRYDEYVVSRYHYLVALTKTDADKWWSIKNKCNIPNPLSWEPQTAVPTPTQQKIVAVGRYSSEKNFEELINIWALVSPQYPGWQLEIIGQGYLQSRLENRISELGLGNSTKLIPPTSNILNKYKEASFLVMTSKYEGFGMVLIEAMSCGLPVISYNCPYGPQEIIHHKKDGFLVPVGDQKQFALYMRKLIESSELRKHMGENALQSSKKYSSQHIIQQWISLFEDLLKARI